MADNIGVLPSTDSTAVDVATDETTINSQTVHTQIIKLALGGLGSATLLQGGSQAASSCIPIVEGNAGALLRTLSSASSETTDDLDVSGYKNISIFWDVTAITGRWTLKLAAYNNSEGQEFTIPTSIEAGKVGAFMRTVSIRAINKIKIYHTPTDGTISSTTEYILQ